MHADLSFNCCLLPARLAATAWPPAPACPQIPAHKVKLVVGAGGEKIKFIQKKAKCRIQVCLDWLSEVAIW